MSRPRTIAIDGPAASGKGTIAKRLAAHYGLAYLDTGSLYRAVGLAVLASGGDPADPVAAERAARALDPAHLDDPALKSAEAGEAASKVAVHPGVRAALLAFQRQVAAAPGGAVLDGRDIGTVVLPEADAKLFVTASLEERARRRVLELDGRVEPEPLARMIAALAERDRRDAGRAAAPMAQAADAHLLDTTNLSIDGAFAAAKALIESRTDRLHRG
jgi:cytidylate kinase